MTPSKEAVKLAVKYTDQLDYVQPVKDLIAKTWATEIDTALVKARLEGAKVMQAKATAYLENCPKPKACYIRNLGPQQVINESVGK